MQHVAVPKRERGQTQRLSATHQTFPHGIGRRPRTGNRLAVRTEQRRKGTEQRDKTALRQSRAAGRPDQQQGEEGSPRADGDRLRGNERELQENLRGPGPNIRDAVDDGRERHLPVQVPAGRVAHDGRGGVDHVCPGQRQRTIPFQRKT